MGKGTGAKIDVYKSDGTTNIKGNHVFKAMDLGQHSVTNFSGLVNLM